MVVPGIGFPTDPSHAPLREAAEHELSAATKHELNFETWGHKFVSSLHPPILRGYQWSNSYNDQSVSGTPARDSQRCSRKPCAMQQLTRLKLHQQAREAS